MGLVSTADIAVCVSKAKFTLSEVKLGIIPATISPYVVRRIGAANARRFFLTAEQISADMAIRTGLVHEVVEDTDGLEEMEAHFKKHILINSPAAVAASKELIDAVEGQPISPELIGTGALLHTSSLPHEACRGVVCYSSLMCGMCNGPPLCL